MNKQRKIDMMKARQATARDLAAKVLKDYGNDPVAYSDRLLALANGQRWLEDMVRKELRRAA